jgi:hypothetical protein
VVFLGGGFVAPLVGMLCDTLCVEFNFGEFGFCGACRGVPHVVGSRDKREADRRHVEDGSEGDCK